MEKRDEPPRRLSGGLRWTFRAGRPGIPRLAAAALQGEGDRAPAGGLGSGAKGTRTSRVLKDSPSRKTVLVPPFPGEKPAVVKTYRPRGPAAGLRALALGHPASREWRALTRLFEAGVAVPEPLALGEPRGLLGAWRRGVLVLEAVPGAVTIEEILLGKAPSPLPPPIAAARLGGLVRSMHDAGVLHPDLHAANVLASRRGGLYLIDFHSARLHPFPPPFSARRKDLLSLSGAFLLHGRRTDRLRFFKAYSKGRAGMEDFKKAARRLEDAARRRLRAFLEKYDRRPLKEGRAYRRLAIHDWTGMGENSERAAGLARFLGDHPEETLEAEGRPIKGAGRATVHSLPFAGGRYIVKIYRQPGLPGLVKRIGEGPRARIAWINGHRLLHRALPAARPVLYLSEPLHAPGGRSLVVFEEAEGVPSLDRFAARAPRPLLAPALRRLALAVARMHDFFLANRDLKAQNILVRPGGSPLFVDPDGVMPVAEASLYVMARDLSRLNASFPEKGPISAAQRLRFLATYARARRLDEDTIRELRFEIIQMTVAKWEKWRFLERMEGRGRGW